ncbi:MAG TPA: hypothetical protein VMT15_05545 [Bryobacteraceae bacterium]|nr:hypothetical protein [Bryobacteraceae bacterium]
MTLDDHLAGLRTAMNEEIARARSEAIHDLLLAAAWIRAASTEAGQKAALEEAARAFPSETAVLDFLKTLAPPTSQDEIHLRAQRFARVRVAEIQLYHAAAIKTGRASRDVYAALKSQMDAAREAYRAAFVTPANGTADYLHAEFVRSLANDDASLLGPAYPGPLV